MLQATSPATPQFIGQLVDISKAPTISEVKENSQKVENKEITLGDLYGNVLVAIFLDLYYGLAELSAEAREVYKMLYLLSCIYETQCNNAPAKKVSTQLPLIQPFEKIKQKAEQFKQTLDFQQLSECYNELLEFESELEKKQNFFKQTDELQKVFDQVKLNTEQLKRELLTFDKMGSNDRFTAFREKFLEIDKLEFKELETAKSLMARKKQTKIDAIKEHFIAALKNINYTEASKNTFIRYIGDETGDRWLDDELMLRYFQHKTDSDCNFEILVSNHGMEFLEAFFNNFNNPVSNSSQYRSLKQLCKNIEEKGEDYRKEIIELVKKYYLPKLKALSYNLIKNAAGKVTGITLFTHAPVPFNIVRKLADAYDVTYRDETPEQLALTIDAINEKFRASLNADFFKDEKKYYTKNIGSGAGSFSERHPVVQLCWQRHESLYQEGDGKEIVRPGQHPTQRYDIIYIYGHDKKPTKEMTAFFEKQLKDFCKGQLKFVKELSSLQLMQAVEQLKSNKSERLLQVLQQANPYSTLLTKQKITVFVNNTLKKSENILYQIESENNHTHCLDGDMGYCYEGNMVTKAELKVVVSEQHNVREFKNVHSRDVLEKQGFFKAGPFKEEKSALTQKSLELAC